MILRIHYDAGTVDIETKNARYAEHLATKGVWVNANKFIPPQRIIQIELINEP